MTGEGAGLKASPFSRSASLAQIRSAGLMETGLKPIYPSEAKCPIITSFFGEETRSDGSLRNPRNNYGYHGGIDIPVPEGTPILAIADGTVIQKMVRGRLTGILIALQHSPDDTGVRVWSYSKYKHLEQMPDLEIGERVKMGQTIGFSGKTGTTGGYYGDKGFPHLHVSTYMSSSNQYRAKRRLIPIGGQYLDPLAFYFRKVLDTNSILSLSDNDKNVKIPYMTTDGKVVPANSRVVWPLPCNPR